MDPGAGSGDQNGSSAPQPSSDPASVQPGPDPAKPEDFHNTGRTGRRNALGDILDNNVATLTTADLPDQFQSLSFSQDGPPGSFNQFGEGPSTQ